MKSAVLPEPNTISSVDAPDVYVSEPARRRLDALRSSVDMRLAALEAALADPSRGDALEALILDLARVACEESQSAAAHACADTRLEAEMHIAQARSAAQAVVEQEYASSADVRRALEEARQQIAVLQREKDDLVQQTRQAFELDLARERGLRGELERESVKLEHAAEEARSELTAERAASKNLRQEVDRLDTEFRALQQEHAEFRSVRERLEGEIARGRDAVAESQRAHAETQTQLALERNAVSELRRAAEKTADQLSVLGRREAEARNGHEHITKAYDETVSELRRERESYAQLREAHKSLQTRVDADQSVNADGERVLADLRQRLEAEQATVAELRRQQASLQERFETERAASADRSHAEAELKAALDAERSEVADLKQTIADLQNRFDAERATTAELRRATAQAEARMQTAVDTEHALRAQLSEAATSGKHKSNNSEAAARQVAALTADLEAERRLVGDLRSAQSESERRWENERSSSATRAADQIAALTTKLEAEQRATTELRRKESDLEARVAAERAANAELRQDMVRTQERNQSGNQDVQSVREALAHARAEVQSLRDELEAARSRVETVLGERADAERLLHESETRLKRAQRDRDELASRLDGTHEPAKGGHAETGKTIPSATPLSVLPHPAAKTPHRAQGKAVAKTKDSEWVAVRTSPRYGFSDPVTVQINGTPGQLCDLSAGGCQVLSPNALKPNQVVKVTLPSGPKPLSCSGKIIWAKLEAPALGRPAGYRAGVQFTKPDQAAIDAFIISHRATALV